MAWPTTACVQEPNDSPTQLVPRRKPRKRQKRKGKKKVDKKKTEKQPRRHRVPSGVPEQESGTSPLRASVSPVEMVRVHESDALDTFPVCT